jgi:hypothetical protein
MVVEVKSEPQDKIDRFRSRTRTSKMMCKWRQNGVAYPYMGTTHHFHVVFDVRVLDLNLSKRLHLSTNVFPLGSGNEEWDSSTAGDRFFLNSFLFFFSFLTLSCSCSIRVRFSASAKLSTAMARKTLSKISTHC